MKPYILAVTFSVFAATAQATTPGVSTTHLPASFGNIDSDQNGYVSKVEAASLSGLEQNFDTADANQDGQLDEQEFTDATSVEEVK